MNRRKFFALLPAAPVAIATWPADAAPKVGAPPDNTNTLVLHGNKPKVLKSYNSAGFISYDQPDPNRQVTMGVGDDGSLWIRNSSDEWKRVVTE